MYITNKDKRIIKNCLDYCWHRLTKHHYCGLNGWANSEDVGRLRKLFEFEPALRAAPGWWASTTAA